VAGAELSLESKTPCSRLNKVEIILYIELTPRISIARTSARINEGYNDTLVRIKIAHFHGKDRDNRSKTIFPQFFLFWPVVPFTSCSIARIVISNKDGLRQKSEHQK
jgi:hypothetical protein